MRTTISLKNGSKASIYTEDLTVYLSGSMELSSDGGNGWRDVVATQLESLGFTEENIFNPCKKPLPKDHPCCLQDDRSTLSALKKEGRWSDLERYVDFIARYDLALVSRSDFLIVNLGTLDVGFSGDFAKQMNEICDNISSPRLVSQIHTAVSEFVRRVHSVFIPTFGTTHEIVEARRQNKPVFLVCRGGLQALPSWMIWLCGYQNIFDSMDEAIYHIGDILKGRVSVSDTEWCFRR